MDFKKFPIGIDNFLKLRMQDYYYVDKTLLIKDLLDYGGEVNLFTRPRRFGKTLNLSMLQYFFEKGASDCTSLFKDLKIINAGEKYLKHMGQYPVVTLSLKSAKQPSFHFALKSLREAISGEYRRHLRNLDVEKLGMNKERFLRIASEEGDVSDYNSALKFLSECLSCYYKKKVIILIDEYDVPLENSYFMGFYEEMTEFIRSLFESALKTNEYLQFSVITGCLRISKESIFTGLNHFEIISITNVLYAEHFGFTPSEVNTILKYYERENHAAIAKEWYDGYLFGETEVYNPWSILEYVKDLFHNVKALPRPYWANVSSNHIIQELVQKGDSKVKSDLEFLIAGQEIKKPIREDITYADVYDSQDNLWNFLYFTGYLTKLSEELIDDTIYMYLKIPNKEIKSIYKRTILTWFDKMVQNENLQPLFDAFIHAKVEKIEKSLSELMIKSISMYDYAELFYQGLLVGIFSNMQNHYITSNRESGIGRYDIQVENPVLTMPSFIIELKVTKNFSELETLAQRALFQIEEKRYDESLRRNGHNNILKYGIAFQGKQCKVRCKPT